MIRDPKTTALMRSKLLTNTHPSQLEQRRLNSPSIEPLVVSPKTACGMLGCGVTELYKLLGSGEITSYRDGRRRKLVVASLRDYVAKKLAADAGKVDGSPTARATATRRAKRSTHSAN
jgi:excisionase family DNA binding protein